jgi:hypothetical protein
MMFLAVARSSPGQPAGLPLRAPHVYQAGFTIEAADDAVVLGMTTTVRLVRKVGRVVARLPLDAIDSDGNSASVLGQGWVDGDEPP